MNNSFTVRDAVAIATNWIHHSDLSFRAAFIGGSAAHADPASPYDSASDIDCYLVMEGDPPNGKIGKITVDGVLLDISWMPCKQLEHAASDAVFASLIHHGKIITDTDGSLSTLKQDIDLVFDTSESIAMRLEDMRARIRPLASPVTQAQLAPPEQVMNWLFPATLATHIPLIKACAPLTVRKRFVAAKNVMHDDHYEELLAHYGFRDVSREQAQAWLDDTATLFDYAAPLAAESARFWASDIKTDARAISIGGSQHLIDTGLHREALYWIIATRTRCLTVMNDMEADVTPFIRAFNDMTLSLGILTAPQRTIRTRGILDWIEN